MSEDPAPADVTAVLDLEPNDHRRLAALCGPFDSNIQHLEHRLGIHIRIRGNNVQLRGPQRDVESGSKLLTRLYQETRDQEILDAATLHLFLQTRDLDEVRETEDSSEIVIRTRRKHIKPRGNHQIEFVENIRRFDVNFGVGPAGTGKTYLAVACAVEALEQEKVSRILLVRPAVEVGEKLGFLPGDLAQKIDPYLRPLYDALYEMLGTERVGRLIERNVIEIAPLAYMRGRTLNNAFIILDEGQNTTIAQMKMFLTRIGFNSTLAITGDITQIDLPQHQSEKQSGLIHVLGIIGSIRGVSVTRFDSRDVVRHPLVQKIVDAYDRDKSQKKGQAAEQRRGGRSSTNE